MPARHVGGAQGGEGAAAGAAPQAQVQLRLEAQRRRSRRPGSASARPTGCGASGSSAVPSPQIVEEASKGSQEVGLRVKLGPVGVDAQVAEVQRDALEDVGDRVRGRAVDFADVGDRVEAQRLAHDDGAGVEGAGHRRGDRHRGDRVAVVGAGEVELAGHVGELGADPRPGQGAADLGGRRAARGVELFLSPVRALAGAAPGDRRLGAVGDAGELGHHAGRQHEGEAAHVLFAVVAGQAHRRRGSRSRPRC